MERGEQGTKMNRLMTDTYREDLNSVCMEKLPFEKLKNRKILITGATGLIGTGLVDTLMWINREKNLSMQVDVLCRNEKKAENLFERYLKNTGKETFRIIKGDLTGAILPKEEYDYIIYGGGNNHPAAFAKEPVETMKTSLCGTMNLLDKLSKQRNHPVFLLLSSGEVYGNLAEMEETGCQEEITGTVNPMETRSCYPEAKRAAETLCRAYAEEYQLDTKVARLCYIFGATYQEESTKADVQFLKKAVAKQDIVLKSAGLQYRSYCYLRDAVAGIFYILLKGEKGEAYNVSNPNMKVTIREFAETLAQAAGVHVVFEHPEDLEQKGYSTLSREILDSAKLQKLGYRAKVGLQEAMERILQIREDGRTEIWRE